MQEIDKDNDDFGEDDPNFETDKVEELEMKELEKLIAQNHSGFNKISKYYKLFEYVVKRNPK